MAIDEALWEEPSCQATLADSLEASANLLIVSTHEVEAQIDVDDIDEHEVAAGGLTSPAEEDVPREVLEDRGTTPSAAKTEL